MRKHTAKKQIVMGLWIAGLALLGSVNAAVIGVDSDWSTPGDLDGWFAGGSTPPTLGNTAGYLSASGPATGYRYAARNVDGGSLALGVGETMSLTFDIARDAAVAGEMRVYLMNNTTDVDSYMFRASLGAVAADTRIGFVDGFYPAKFPTTTYLSVAASDVVGTNIASDFDTFEFAIERTDADTMAFNLFQNEGALLSITQDFDGTDQSAADLLTSFGRVYIAWTDGLEEGESVYIDNVKLQVIPEASSLSLIGFTGAALLGIRRIRI
ncbi:MAG: hypothetical protein U9P12_09900 [Verrucomicrobiota bacterium]|nr:hypothetical protein [Verrucomicrobiota bacterium]